MKNTEYCVACTNSKNDVHAVVDEVMSIRQSSFNDTWSTSLKSPNVSIHVWNSENGKTPTRKRTRSKN